MPIKGLKRDEWQVGDTAEVAGISGTTGVAELESTRSDPEIARGKIGALGGLFAPVAGDDFRSWLRQRVDGNRGFQIDQERTAALADFRWVGAIDAVADLGNRHGR